MGTNVHRTFMIAWRMPWKDFKIAFLHHRRWWGGLSCTPKCSWHQSPNQWMNLCFLPHPGVCKCRKSKCGGNAWGWFIVSSYTGMTHDCMKFFTRIFKAFYVGRSCISPCNVPPRMTIVPALLCGLVLSVCETRFLNWVLGEPYYGDAKHCIISGKASTQPLKTSAWFKCNECTW